MYGVQNDDMRGGGESYMAWWIIEGVLLDSPDIKVYWESLLDSPLDMPRRPESWFCCTMLKYRRTASLSSCRIVHRVTIYIFSRERPRWGWTRGHVTTFSGHIIDGRFAKSFANNVSRQETSSVILIVQNFTVFITGMFYIWNNYGLVSDTTLVAKTTQDNSS